jgi:hypothetical protein
MRQQQQGGGQATPVGSTTRAALLVQLLRCPKSSFTGKIMLTQQIGVRAALKKAKRKKDVCTGERKKTLGQ